VIAMLVRGDGNCAETQWQFLGLSIPAWVLVNCSLLLAVGLLQLLRKD
jgi:disulfide bond formation protein DsbB